MERTLHNVADLPAAARSAVEAILGHALKSDQMLYIATVDATKTLNDAERNTGWDELESIIRQMQENAGKCGLSPEQIDEMVDSESSAVRFGSKG